MKTTKFRKIVSALMASTLVLSSAGTVLVSAETETEAAYQLVNNITYENIASNVDNCWDYANGGGEGSRKFDHTDGFSGSTSIRVTGNGSGYGTFQPYAGWGGTYQNHIELNEGKTVIMTLKFKKVGTKAGFSGVRGLDKNGQNQWVWGQSQFKPADSGWKTASYKFVAGEAQGDGAVFVTGAAPQFIWNGNADSDIVLVDDVRAMQINDTSILNDTDPTAEIASITPQGIKITFTQEMNEDDVKNVKAYMVNGEVAKSVTYDAKAKTATVIPKSNLVPETEASVVISANDYLCRALYTTLTKTVDYPAETVYTTSIDDEVENGEIDSINSITLSFSNVMDETTVTNKDNYTFAAGESGHTIKSVSKVDDKTFKVEFDSFLKAGSYTLDIKNLKDTYNRSIADKQLSFTVKKVLPALASATPASGTADIPAGDKEVSLTFNKNIDPTTVSGITVDNDATVSTPVVNDNVVTFTLGGLQSATTYTVTISGVKDVDGETVEDTTLTYYTAKQLLEIYDNSFENAAAEGGVLGDLDWRRFQLNGNKSIIKTDSVVGESCAEIQMTDKNNADVMMGTSDASVFKRVPLVIGKKYVLKFYIKYPEGSTVSSFSIVNGDNKSYVGGAKITDVEGKDGWKSVVCEFTAKSAVEAENQAGSTNSPSIRMNVSDTNNMVLRIDGLSIYQYPDVEVKNDTLGEGSEVSVTEDIEMTFDSGITSATANIGGKSANVTVNGNKVSVDTDGLDCGRFYELELSVVDGNGVTTTHKKKFKTEASVNVKEVKVGDTEYTEGMNVSKLSDFNVNLGVAAKSAKDIYVVVAVYDENGYMTEVKCEKVSFASGASTKGVTMDKTKLENGKTIKVYIWNGFDKTEIVNGALEFNLI